MEHSLQAPSSQRSYGGVSSASDKMGRGALMVGVSHARGGMFVLLRGGGKLINWVGQKEARQSARKYLSAMRLVEAEKACKSSRLNSITPLPQISKSLSPQMVGTDDSFFSPLRESRCGHYLFD